MVVMDGIGLCANEAGNAVALANTPTLDYLFANYPHTALKAHGTAVGLPSDEDMGNSEVGHNAMGAGKVYDQGAMLVNSAIETGRMFESAIWKSMAARCRGAGAGAGGAGAGGAFDYSTLIGANTATCVPDAVGVPDDPLTVTAPDAAGGALHFIGLFSDGNVHSHIDHLKAMIARAKKDGVGRVRVHILLDGRDVGETSALEYVEPFERFLAELSADGTFSARIASGGGRMKITMDRYEANWGMVELGWKTHVLAEGRYFPSAAAAITEYRSGVKVIDQDLPPFVIADGLPDGCAGGVPDDPISVGVGVPDDPISVGVGVPDDPISVGVNTATCVPDAGGVPDDPHSATPVGPIRDGDAVIFFNFRGDRAIEISKAFTDADFDKFDRVRVPDVLYAGMLEYDGDLHIPKNYLVSPPEIRDTLGEHLCESGVRSLAISETQKYGHVTYFWNGNRSGKFDDALETYIEVPSDIVPFEQRPWMKAAESTDALIRELETGKYAFARVNFANGDMVGHTGDLDATRIAVETVDLCLARILKAVDRLGGMAIITADHGNADEMYELDKKSGLPAKDKGGGLKAKTSHTLNPVPCIFYDNARSGAYAIADGSFGLSNIASTIALLLGFIPYEHWDAPIIKLL